ncbi:GTPase domain-containing protein [Acinetobacter pittii]|uniref:GTPase domain-containing protein n=1 Tax=Acinetobacter pittii TaxID=48296 RepID=UPI00197E83C3|nr:GTPase domain-containing protein [Acinetobacter pittii]MBN6535263.1 GTPase domain-containing protein [Acinetobacter pittii]
MNNQIKEIVSDTLPVIRQVNYAYKYRHLIQKLWVNLQVKLSLGKPKILMLGQAGVGKSVLCSTIHGEANTLDWQKPDTSRDVEIKPIQLGAWTQIVSVIPGQDSSERLNALDKAINSNGIDGIIYVVDWGYTSIREPHIRNAMIEISGIDSIKKLREKNLETELDDFSQLLHLLKMSIPNNRGPKWIMIAINKLDLFKNEEHEAIHYYKLDSNSDFQKKISEFISKVGSQNIKFDFQLVNARSEKFVWGKEEITPLINEIDEHQAILKKFIDNLAFLVDKAE